MTLLASPAMGFAQAYADARAPLSIHLLVPLQLRTENNFALSTELL